MATGMTDTSGKCGEIPHVFVGTASLLSLPLCGMAEHLWIRKWKRPLGITQAAGELVNRQWTIAMAFRPEPWTCAKASPTRIWLERHLCGRYLRRHWRGYYAPGPDGSGPRIMYRWIGWGGQEGVWGRWNI